MKKPTPKTPLPSPGILQLVSKEEKRLTAAGLDRFPALIVRTGERAAFRFVEFFTANIRNGNTRRADGLAVGQFFTWCEDKGLEMHQLNPIVVAAYIEQHRAALRILFDWLVLGQILPTNPASSVRRPSTS